MSKKNNHGLRFFSFIISIFFVDTFYSAFVLSVLIKFL